MVANDRSISTEEEDEAEKTAAALEKLLVGKAWEWDGLV